MSEEKAGGLRASGQCLCGGVRYEVRGPLRPVLECYCHSCRRFSGGIWNGTAARRPDVSILDGGSLIWYRSSPLVQRGFCGMCGSSLFVSSDRRDYLAIAAGTLNEPTGLKFAARIVVSEAPDCYDFSPEVRRVPDSNHGLDVPQD